MNCQNLFNCPCCGKPYLFLMKSVKNLTSPRYEDSDSFPSSIFIRSEHSGKDSGTSNNHFDSFKVILIIIYFKKMELLFICQFK